MTKRRINVEDLSPFDVTPCRDSEDPIAAYLTDIVEVNDAALLAAAIGDIAHARGATDVENIAGTNCGAFAPSESEAQPRRRMTVDQMLSLGADITALPILDLRSSREVMDDLNET